MEALIEKIEQARRDLLDLGLRNTLLNYRELKSKGVRVINKDPKDIFRTLVIEKRGMSFVPVYLPKNLNPSSTQTSAQLFDVNLWEQYGNTTPESSNKLPTPYNEENLNKRLLNTYYTARTAIEEQGVNILFLALGMLEWYEDESSDLVRKAPLILIPVHISRENVRAEFKVKYTEEDVGANLSLEMKVKTEFGIDLPGIQNEEEIDVLDYFSKIEKAVSMLPRWRVDKDSVVLGFFSFSKLLMFKDLDSHNWPENAKPYQHEILRALLVDGFGEWSLVINEDENLDEKIDIADLHQICDADSSQTEVILESKQGRSLVIQGPPGTGKSQTITNLIAEALADNKTVLFVAEKMAALEVVKRRLDIFGLGDACLELHSHKTNKKIFLEELQRTLELGQPKYEDREHNVADLYRMRARLNNYVRAIHTPIKQSGITPYNAYGKRLHADRNLQGKLLPPISSIKLERWPESEYLARRELVAEFQVLLKQIGAPQEHLFWGSTKTVYLPTDKQRIEETCQRALETLETSRQFIAELCDILGVKEPQNLSAANSLLQVLRNGLVLAEYYPKWWRFFSSKYRTTRREMVNIAKAREIEAEVKDDVLLTTRIIIHLLPAILQDSSAKIQDLLITGRDSLNELIENVESAIVDHSDAVAEVIKSTGIDEKIRFEGTRFLYKSFDEQVGLLQSWLQNAVLLRDIVRWNYQINKMREQGLAQIAEIAKQWDLAAEHLVDLLDYVRYTDLISLATEERPDLASFDRDGHERALEKFQKLDKRLLDINRAYLAQKHWEKLPTGNSGQMAVLRREFEKKRRHRPIRQLMLDAGKAIQAIKPVFLMSPLSVATYIPPGSVNFDLVIFDEASQVRPADAFGSILRGKQIIVVGDSQQLPPTSFFDKVGYLDEDDNWDASPSDMESILGLFLAQGAPEVMLRWHYRSRHHSLITVSNQEFYNNKLIVFPAPNEGSSELGLQFRHLENTYYERGKAVNRGEARIVAQAVMEHACNYPDLTLGVATFSVAQMQAIQDELEILRRSTPSCEGFFHNHVDEPFFVKNLENVQGDERDVIFISIGYGYTRDGFVSMNFGPLNQEGGERRLNVLITRSRMRCVVFTNLRADDIDLTRTKSRGVAALKTFLKFAETGNLDVPRPTGQGPDSPFEEEVAQRLVEQGYKVHYQVGSAGFRIDLAVVDPSSPGRYLLGIECDGATYHSSRWARDRDRLRQQILENLGWKIHRIWSTDWFHNPDKELRRVLKSIEEAKNNHDITTDNRGSGVTVSTNTGSSFNKNDRTNFCATIERVPVQHPQGTRSIAYKMASIGVLLGNQQLHEVSVDKIAKWVDAVVRVESPVHVEEVIARISQEAGVNRVGSRIRKTLERGVKLAVMRHYVRRKGDFLWRIDMDVPPVRNRRGLRSNLRQPDRIALEEIAEAIMHIVKDSIGVKPEDVVVEASRLLGYKRVTDKIRERIQRATRRLINDRRLIEQNGYLVLPK